MVQLSHSMAAYRRTPSNSQIIREKMQILRSEQNILIGIIGGFLGSLIGIGLWALAVAIFHRPVFWMAIPSSVLVGLGVHLLGRGIDKGFGIAGVFVMILTLLGGGILTSLLIPVHQTSPGMFDSIFRLGKAVTLNQLLAALPLFNILCCAIALVVSYSTSFRQVTREQLLRESKLRSAIQQ